MGNSIPPQDARSVRATKKRIRAKVERRREPTEAEAAGQLLTHGGDEILNILPEDAPACKQVAAPTNAQHSRKPRQQPARSVRLLSRTHGMYELPDVATVEITMMSNGPRIGSRTDTFRCQIHASHLR